MLIGQAHKVSEYLYGAFTDNYAYRPEAVELFDDLVRKYTEMVLGLADLLSSVPDTSDIEIDQDETSSPGMDQATLDQEEESPPAASTSSSSLVAGPSNTVSRVHHRNKIHQCIVCGTQFDRFSRARDCKNKDLGLTPHACGGRCWRVNWYVFHPNSFN